MVKPISPRDIARSKNFPDEAIEAFNELIANNFRYGKSTVYQDQLNKLIRSKYSSFTDIIFFSEHELNIEYLYRSQGWNVQGYISIDKEYEPIFVFSIK